MIRFPLASLYARANHRPAGYVEDVLSVASVDGDTVEMTEEAWAELVKKYRNAIQKVQLIRPATEGVGAHLKRLLSKIGISPTPNCACNRRAKEMDDRGVEWCRDNIDLIVGWLREEAERRKLPFFDFVGKQLVLLAIKKAEKQNI